MQQKPTVFDEGGARIPPDALATAGRCPETGISLAGLDLEAHIASLWPGARSEEAKRRIELIRAHGRKVAAAAAQAMLDETARAEAAAARK
jgi:hypothetical protein